MDAIDGQVIGCLLHNARATFAEIGAEVGLSAPAVKRRVDRLVASGAIRGFTALIDPDVLGWQTEAYVEIYCKGTVAPADLRRSLERVPEVVGAATVSGDGRRPRAHARLGREAARAGAGADPGRAQRRPHPQRHRAVPADRPPAHLSASPGRMAP